MEIFQVPAAFSLTGSTPQVVFSGPCALAPQFITGHFTAVGSDFATNTVIYLHLFDSAVTSSLATPRKSIKVPYNTSGTATATYNPAGNSTPDISGINGTLTQALSCSNGIVVALSTTPATYTAAASGSVLFIDSIAYTTPSTYHNTPYDFSCTQ